MAQSINIRQLVMDMLLEVESGQVYSHVLIREVQNKYNYLSVQEKSFLKRLFEGTLERMIEIDYVIDQFSKVKVAKMKPVIRAIMRMSVYQILYMDSVPDAAASNEAVKLTQHKKFATLKGFVNGVLRNIARNKAQILYPDKKADYVQYLSVTYSMPEWIIRMWIDQLGKNTTEEVLNGLLQEHPVTIRILRTELTDVLLDKMRKQGIEVKQHLYYKHAYTLHGSLESVMALPGFAEGDITIQDVSSMMSVLCAGIRPGDQVIDVCAAPGGKTMFASALCTNSGRVLARDVSDSKVNMILENVERCQLQNVTAEVWDATVLDEASVNSADVVIADLPCSGLGVMGKKRDIKYHVTPDSLATVAELQRSILKVITSYVKPGGVLLYSTCTINREENEEMADWIEEQFPFKRESLRPYLPEVLGQCSMAEDGYLQLLPGVQDSDGFFIARFRKV